MPPVTESKCYQSLPSSKDVIRNSYGIFRIVIYNRANFRRIHIENIKTLLLSNITTLIKRSNGAFERELNPIDLLAPQFVQPEKNNPRILKQDGAFIISGLDKNADESNMKIRKYLVNEIHVPALCKALIKDQLANVGISQATLFPEVDKVADYLKRIL